MPLPAPRPPKVVAASELTPELFARFRNRRPLLIKRFLPAAALAAWTGPDLYGAPERSGLVRHLLPFGASGAGSGEDGEDGERAPPAQTVSVEVLRARDGRSFVDDDRFTSRESVDTRELVGHVLLRQAPPATAAVTGTGNGTVTVTATETERGGSEHRRMYYRAVVPEPLRDSLQIEALLRPSCLTVPDQDRINPALVKAWVSSPGCVTPLHYDRCHGFLLQIIGAKYFMQFDAEDTGNLYLSNSPSLPSHVSRVPNVTQLYGISARTGERTAAFTNSDRANGGDGHDGTAEAVAWTLAKFPRVREAEPFGTLLEPGDALYTPPGWLHEVTSVSGSVSVTIPWDQSDDEYAHIKPYMTPAAALSS
ncbi:hypothetical protein H9P43_010160 [Blastocladiella emersonii ATCC 22665]|nr:hypothetical protein H9P43_010153 [Blastocladiella emersonii ATCC 22665]KAI9148562.1 hypothetical protein H9P43_010160 [Blastocladiella emersonii ATCC 22665]